MALHNCWCGFFQSSKNEVMNCGQTAAFNFAPKFNLFSAQAWIKTTTVPSVKQWVVARGLSSGVQYGVAWRSDSLLEARIGDTAQTYNASALAGVSVADGNWHHIVLTVSSTQARLYIDGVLLTPALTLSGTTQVAASLLVGGRRALDDTDVAESWDGYLDEVGVWSGVVLSALAVTALYNAGEGLPLDEDSGNYTSADALTAWWRFGEGATENPGGFGSEFIDDVTENGHSGEVESDLFNPDEFYVFDTTLPGSQAGCLPSSSSSAAVPPGFTLLRYDQGTLVERTGFEGKLHRMRVVVEAAGGVDPKILVFERGRVVVGQTIQRTVFRRVATIRDLADVPKDTPATSYPFSYRVAEAFIYGTSVSDLDAVWLEIQKQAAVLSLDLNEFGAVDASGEFHGGRNEFTFVDSQVYAGVPEPAALQSSSSSFSPAAPEESSSLAPVVEGSSSHAPLSSSSSQYIDPYAHEATFEIAAQEDIATRLDDNGSRTLFTDLGFVRFGRDDDPFRTWDAFMRFAVDLPQCIEIVEAYVVLLRHTTEVGSDMVLRIHSIYDDSDLTPISAFSSTNDPPYAAENVVWDRLSTSIIYQTVDIADLLRSFIGRSNYNSGDYFGLWIQELTSDPGARRDASVNSSYPHLYVSYRSDRVCSSSSSAL